MALRREIGLVGLTFVGVGGVLGSGWLFSPLLASQLAGPGAMLAWVIGAVAMLMLAITFAEVSSLFPLAGGIARIPQLTHGNVVSSALGWSAWIGYCTTAPIEVEAMLGYLAADLPWLYAGGRDLSAAGMMVAGLFLVVFTAINAVGVRFFARVNTAITWVKIAVPLVVVAAIAWTRFDTANFTAGGGFLPFGMSGVFAAVTGGGVAFAFIGFRHAIDLAGEARNPHVTIPAALLLAILICFLVYAGIQLAFIGALSQETLASGWGRLDMRHELGPLAGLATALGILWLVAVLNAGAVIAPFGGALVAVGSNGRLAYALARNGFLPRLFTRLSEKDVPLPALLLNLAVSTALFLLLTFHEIIALNGAAIILSFVVGPIAVAALRRLVPDRERPFRMPGGDAFALAAFVAAVLVIFWSGWDTLWRLGLVLALGGGIYLVRIARGRTGPLDLAEATWLVPFLAGLGLISALGSYGKALGVVPHPWDTLVCAAFAAAVFPFAVRARLTQEKFDRYLASEAARAERPQPRRAPLKAQPRGKAAAGPRSKKARRG